MNQLFNYEGVNIGCLTREEESWFVGKDVCEVLDIKNTSQALSGLDDDEKLLYTLHIGGQQRNVMLVSLSGLYSLVFKSSKPNAKAFRRWVTHEVLPSIDKTGRYEVAPAPSYQIEDPIARAERWIEEEKARVALQLETEQQALILAEQAPKVSYYDEILRSTNTMVVTLIAKDYGLKGEELNAILKEAGVQHKVGGQWVLRQAYVREGYARSDTGINRNTGYVFTNTRWTQKGRLFIHELLTKRGISPGGEPRLGGVKRRSQRKKQQPGVVEPVVTLRLTLNT
ncbi:phage antirepressor KilAC domain-containing protein [Paenibacillus algorifonticola]|uniref:phage antirepressor KilAC domain-containing protein n=1 Tax=Paenibacillus algorifonticola TaxID=684063 RepID=UPI003D2B0685